MAETTNDELRELTLLEQIESDPNVNQSTLATQLGVAVGTVNWHLKRLIAKGAVKVSRAERKKLRYIITPEGIDLRARLAVDSAALLTISSPPSSIACSSRANADWLKRIWMRITTPAYSSSSRASSSRCARVQSCRRCPRASCASRRRLRAT